MPRLPRVTQGQVTRSVAQPRLNIGGREPQVSLANVGLPRSRANFRNVEVTPNAFGAAAFKVIGDLGEIIEEIEDSSSEATAKATYAEKVGALKIRLIENPNPGQHLALTAQGLTEIEQEILKSGLTRGATRPIGQFLAAERSKRLTAAGIEQHRLRGEKVLSTMPALIDSTTTGIITADSKEEAKTRRKTLEDTLALYESRGLLSPGDAAKTLRKVDNGVEFSKAKSTLRLSPETLLTMLANNELPNLTNREDEGFRDQALKAIEKRDKTTAGELKRDEDIEEQSYRDVINAGDGVVEAINELFRNRLISPQGAQRLKDDLEKIQRGRDITDPIAFSALHSRILIGDLSVTELEINLAESISLPDRATLLRVFQASEDRGARLTPGRTSPYRQGIDLITTATGGVDASFRSADKGIRQIGAIMEFIEATRNLEPTDGVAHLKIAREIIGRFGKQDIENLAELNPPMFPSYLATRDAFLEGRITREQYRSQIRIHAKILEALNRQAPNEPPPQESPGWLKRMFPGFFKGAEALKESLTKEKR